MFAAATLLKIDARDSGQSRLSSVSSWQDRMAHTEILGLSLINGAGAEIAATMHEVDARRWAKDGGGRERRWVDGLEGWWLVVGGTRKEAGVCWALTGVELSSREDQWLWQGGLDNSLVSLR